MSAQPQDSTDLLLAELLSMGFDLPSCQKAIKAGNTTLQTASDYIISLLDGGAAIDHSTAQASSSNASSGVLHLDLGSTTTPSSLPLPQPATLPNPTPVPHTEAAPKVTSKYRDNRQDIIDMVAKKELELAKQRKALGKDSKKRVMEQIREDRERVKERHLAASSSKPTSTSTPAQSQPTPSSSSSSLPAASSSRAFASSSSALIQVRLPSGRAIKKKFDATAQLSEVFAFVESEVFNGASTHEDRTVCAPGTGYSLLMAFPRKVFARSDEGVIVAEAGLLPSASLNVQRGVGAPVLAAPQAAAAVLPVVAPAAVPDPADVDMQDNRDDEEEPERNDEDEDHDDDGMDDEDGTQRPWQGAGHRLDGSAAQNPAIPPPNQVQPPGGDFAALPMPPLGRGRGRGRGLPVFPGMGRGMGGWLGGAPAAFEGQGHRLGTHLAPVEAPVPEASSEEARATRLSALQRLVEQQNNNMADSESKQAPKVVRPVPNLLDMGLDYVCKMLCSPDVPEKYLYGLKFVGTDAAERIMQRLMSKRLLDTHSLSRLRFCPLQNFQFDSYPFTTDSLLNTVGSIFWHTVTSISVKGCDVLTDDGLTALKNCRSLTYLDISSCKFSDVVVPVIKEYSLLEYLNISGTKLSSKGVKAIATALKGTLRQLLVNRCINVTGNTLLVDLEEVTNLVELSFSSTAISSPLTPPRVKTFGNLQILSCANTSASNDDLRRCVSEMSELVSIDLHGCRAVTDAGVRWLTLACPKLSNVRVSPKDPISDSAMVSTLLASLLPLERLDLASFVISDDALSSLPRLGSTLVMLSFAGVKITDSGLASLQSFTPLRELYLDRTLVTDVILSRMTGLQHLETLSLSETHITDESLKFFPRSEWKRTIKRLNLARTLITDEGIAVGIPSLENLTVLNLDYTQVTLDCPKYFPNLLQLQPVRLAGIGVPKPQEEEGMDDGW